MERDDEHVRGDDRSAVSGEESERSDDSASQSGSGPQQVDISDTSAPSIGPNTEITYEAPEDRLARHDQSSTDAMGLEKRREVVGGSYSASFARQATLYGIFLAVVIGLGVGFKLLADELDQPPKQIEAVAPWTNSTDRPEPIDFRRDSAPSQTPITGAD